MGGETKSAHRILLKEIPAEISLEVQEPEETINLRLLLLLCVVRVAQSV
jgi:hypothetical protein